MENNENQTNNETKVKPEKTDLQKAKKKHLLTCAACLGISIALFALSAVLGDLGVVTLIAGLIFLFLLPIVFVSGKLNIHRVHCKQCGTKYDYNEDVSWVCEGEEEKSGKSGNDYTKTVKATVLFNCTCHACKQVKEFRKKFTTAEWNSSRGWKYHNLDTECTKYFKI